MLWDGVAPLLLFLCLGRANALPLASQLSEEDEKVTKCITEILADTLSKPSPVPATGECLKILREDERVLAMLHHQHLLTELEDLVQQENAKHRLGDEGEGEGHEELKKWEAKPGQQRAASTSENAQQERDGERKEEEQEEYQKTEKTEEKVKEVSHAAGHRDGSEEEEAKEEMEDESEEGRPRQRKKKSSSETWSSREYFGHAKNRGSGGPKTREGMLQGSWEGAEKNSWDKRSFELEGDGDGYDISEEKLRSHHHGGHRREEEEEGGGGEKKRRRAGLAKRVAEKASDEETAQFEEEENRVRLSKGRLHGGWKPRPEEEEEKEEEEEGERRYGHHHRPAGWDLKKRPWEDYPKGRHHGHEEEEGGREARQNESQELEKLEEIERDLQKAAERLRELTRGSPLSTRHGQV